MQGNIGAKVNAQGFKKSWIGYKLHIDSTDAGLPISCIFSSASLHDSQVAIPLADMTALRVTYLYESMITQKSMVVSALLTRTREATRT